MEKYFYNTNLNSLANFNLWFAFPGITSFSLSSVGYLWLSKIMSELEGVCFENICADTEKTKIKPENVDMIAFSFSFDLDFLSIFKILEKYKIPLKFSDRNETHPLLFCGGPVITANPAPYEMFFDFFLIGDGETLNNEVIKICIENKDKPKEEILKKLSELDGVYVPKYKKTVKKNTCNISAPLYTTVISNKAFFKDTFILEIVRGCSNRCGFCLASYLNLPMRFADYDEIIKHIDMALEYTNKIALLGTLITAHPKFESICKYLYAKEGVEMSVSSLRADSISSDTIKTLVKCGQKNSTIAIEAGSERLRRFINKNLTEEQILNVLRISKENGLKGMKIYAMIGLPTETIEDLDVLLDLVRKIKSEIKEFEVSFGFSSFVPKAHTPFQWYGRENTKSLEKKQNYLKKEFHKLGIKAQFSSVKWDYYQAVISRGDSVLGDYLLKVYENGGNLGAFKSAARELGVDTDFYALENYDLNMELPWDIIKINPDKKFLQEENERLRKNGLERNNI